MGSVASSKIAVLLEVAVVPPELLTLVKIVALVDVPMLVAAVLKGPVVAVSVVVLLAVLVCVE